MSNSYLLLYTLSTCNSSHGGLHGCTITTLFTSSINTQGFTTTGMNVKVIVFSFNAEQSPCGDRATAHMSLMDLQYSSNFTFFGLSPTVQFLYFVQSVMRILDHFREPKYMAHSRKKKRSLSVPKWQVH